MVEDDGTMRIDVSASNAIYPGLQSSPNPNQSNVWVYPYAALSSSTSYMHLSRLHNTDQTRPK